MTRPERKPRGVRIIYITCRACDELTILRGEFPPGEITNVKVHHKDQCPYFIAIQAGSKTTSAWLLEHGYPMAYQVVPA